MSSYATRKYERRQALRQRGLVDDTPRERKRDLDLFAQAITQLEFARAPKRSRGDES